MLRNRIEPFVIVPLAVLSLVLFVFALPAVVGCVPPSELDKNDTKAESEDPSSKPDGNEKFVLGDLLEPFKAPPLAELDAKAGWIDRPISDFTLQLRELQKKQKPLVSVEEALRLKNDSPENNAKIVSALGRLPESDDEVDFDATMNRYMRFEIKSTNPLMQSSIEELNLLDLTGFGLFSYNWNLDTSANCGAVKSWKTSKDRTMDKVVMYDDLTWSDGEPITAHDVVFSFKAIMSKMVPSLSLRSLCDKIRWVEAYDDHTLVFFHRDALPTNAVNMSFSVIPKHKYEKSIEEDPTLQDSDYHVKLEDNPVFGGSYVTTKRTRGQELVLTRRESAYMYKGKQVRDKPYIKEVRFRLIGDPSVALMAMNKGDLDELPLTPVQWKEQANDDSFYRLNTKAYGVEWTFGFFGWNLKEPIFADLRVRQALSYAFDYDEMLGKILHGMYEPCNGIYSKESIWAPVENAPQPYRRDLDKAETLLDEAGWTDSDGDGVRDKLIKGNRVKLEFRVITVNKPILIDICNLLKENLDQIGVLCEVRPMEFTVLEDRVRKHNFHAVLYAWGAGTDPDASENIFGTSAMRNFGLYSNPEVDKLFELGRKEFDPKKRVPIYRKIHTLIYEDQPYTFLYFRNTFQAFSKDLRGYKFSPMGPYNYAPGFYSIWKAKK